MNLPKKPPPRFALKREGETKPTASTVSFPRTPGKPFDAVEKKLSLTLDALLNAIDAYREFKR